MTRVKLNLAGFRQLRTSEAAQALVQAEADKIAERADLGVDSDNEHDHVVHVSSHGDRARAVVVTATAEAMLAEAKDRNLIQAVHGG